MKSEHPCDFTGFDIDIDAAISRVRTGSWHQFDISGNRHDITGPLIDHNITNGKFPTGVVSENLHLGLAPVPDVDGHHVERFGGMQVGNGLRTGGRSDATGSTIADDKKNDDPTLILAQAVCFSPLGGEGEFGRRGADIASGGQGHARYQQEHDDGKSGKPQE